jgi:hypothetical protein
MAKYELMKKTELDGQVWYYIRKDEGLSVEKSWTKDLQEAEQMLIDIEEGKPTEPTLEVIKTIKIEENGND